MAVSLAQLSVALRITVDATATVPEPENGILTRIQSWAESEIAGRAPNAPANYQDQALVVLAGYVHDRPPVERGGAYANAWEHSGASDILRRWVNRRGFLLDNDPEDSSMSTTTTVDQTARDAAAAAREAAAQANQNLVDQDGVQGIVDRDVESWALLKNRNEKIPATKLPDASSTTTPSPSRSSTILHEDVRLPAPARAMRIGWNQSRAITAAVFTRANQHPIDGAVLGTTTGLEVPPAPPALAGDQTLYLAVWIEGDGDDDTVIRFGDDATDSMAPYGGPNKMPMALEVNGVAGHYHVTRERLSHDTTRRLSVQIPGDMILGERDVAAWALTGNTDPIPADKLTNVPAGAGGGSAPVELGTVAKADSTTTTSYRRWTLTLTRGDFAGYSGLRMLISVGAIRLWSPTFQLPDPLSSTTFAWAGWSTGDVVNRLHCALVVLPGTTVLARMDAYPVDATSTIAIGGPQAVASLYGVS